jgi:ABC-type transporter Mla maintaining outer membrane lipid asymmetry ATPase subunit MlaF
MSAAGEQRRDGVPGAREALLDVRGVSKDYHGLRPLRIQRLELYAGQSLALLGFDQTMAEVLVNLITGAHLPDTGEIRVFGRTTTSITSAEEWIHTLDQFGLVSERAVLVDELTAEQNVAMPLSLEITDMSLALRRQVRQLADEVSLTADELSLRTGALRPAARLRLRLARALALGPRVLLAEHPNAALPGDEAPAFAADFARIVEARQLGSVVLTADRTFAGAVADQVLTLEPATGLLKSDRGWRRWFS